LTNTASSSAAVLSGGTVGLYNASGTQVATAVFSGSATTTLANFIQDFTVPADSDARLTIKANLSDIGTSQAGTEGAFLAVDYDFQGQAGAAVATGSQSGTSATNSSSADTAVSGVRVFNSYPVLAKDTLSSNTLANGDRSLLRFKVTANSAGDIGIGKFTLRIATTSTDVTNINVYAYTDSGYSTAVGGLTSGGKVKNADVTSCASTCIVEIPVQNASAAAQVLTVPAGSTYYFDVRGTVSSAGSGDSITTQLEGDSAYPALSGLMDTFTNIDNDTNDDFIWSPLATSTDLSTNDWTNGYGLIGLPGTNMSSEVLSL
jgi:hypothetical protein